MSTKKGRSKFVTPKELWEHFLNYVKWTEENPRMQEQATPRGGVAKVALHRALTFDSFEVYLFKKDVIKDLGDYARNKDGRYDEYATIISRIKKTIRADQIEGGLVNQYNANLTARLNGLGDKQDITSEGKKITSVIKFGDKEISI
jgi:hypothetical protein